MTGRTADRHACLGRLLAARFHQDWTAEHASAEACLDAAVASASVEDRRGAAAEIDRLLDGRLCESQIRDVLLYEVGCHYALERDGLDASTWLGRVRAKLGEAMAESSRRRDAPVNPPQQTR